MRGNYYNNSEQYYDDRYYEDDRYYDDQVQSYEDDRYYDNGYDEYGYYNDRNEEDEYYGTRIENCTIKKVNKKRLSNLGKSIIINMAVTAIVASSILIGGKMVNKPATMAPIVPDGYVQITIDIQADSGDKISEIAEQYYNEESYPGYYVNFDDYVKSIAKRNNAKSDNISKFQNVSIPVIVEENNVYLERIAQLNEELNGLKEQEWISYTINSGDTLYSLAWKGAGDGDEANKNMEAIIQANNLSSSSLTIGDRIKIINPEIGRIKQEIIYLKDQLTKSLVVENQSHKTK